jgi:magnesium transporter
MDIKDLINLFRDVNSTLTSSLFDELSQDKKEELVKAMTDKDLVKVINEQAADDLADTVGDMPANLAIKVLHAADKDMRQDLNQLLKYKPDTAGAIMTTEYLEFREGQTVGDTIEQVRSIGREAETVYTIFVRNNKRKFVGTVDLDDLIFAKKEQTLEEIMNKDAPSVHWAPIKRKSPTSSAVTTSTPWRFLTMTNA